MSKSFLAILIGSVVIIILGFIVLGLNFLLPAVLLVLALLLFSYPLVGVVVLLGTLFLGQLVRVPLAQEAITIIPSDVVLIALIVGWLIRKLIRGESISWPMGSLPIFLFVAASIVSLVHALTFLPVDSVVNGSLFLFRWALYLLVYLIVYDIVKKKDGALSRNVILISLFIVGALLAIIGFFQLSFMPDFSFATQYGWDPHQGRLLATWFDPNFLGEFFVLLISLGLGLLLALSDYPRRWNNFIRYTMVVYLGLLTVALALTQSRSSYLAFVVSVFLISLIFSRRISFIVVIVLFLASVFIPGVADRATDFSWEDFSIQARFISWSGAWSVITEHPWLGIGFNTYRDYQFLQTADEGLLRLHSATGADSSILTILLLTGVVGLVFFLSWLARTAWSIWRSYTHGGNALLRSLSLGLLGAGAGLLIHSIFVNSLLYPHILLVLWTLLGIWAGEDFRHNRETS